MRPPRTSLDWITAWLRLNVEIGCKGVYNDLYGPGQGEQVFGTQHTR